MRVEVVADGMGFTEGPVALSDGRVALVSISHGCVYVVAPDGSRERIVTGGGPNGLAVGAEGELYVAQNGGIWGGSGPAPAGVQVIRDGRVEYVVDDLGAPNDLVLGPDGRLWVTDPVAEFSGQRPQDARPGRVYSVDVASGSALLELDEGPVFVNGLAFSEDGSELLVTVTLAMQLVAYSVTASGLGEARTVHTFGSGANPDGMVRSGQHFWVALLAADRLDLVDLDGDVRDSVALPAGSLPTNVCLDHDGTGLYVTAGFAQALLHVTP
ncbi:MAG TPA: SMP-30/gluconolactonase/LRE family protein [Nocardioides sp.]|uniref:SMP-30/gluconolactonase/LRE family protein n=1 Tax=Nocardioides sp. TaxID=35761 RepID=UPI002BE644C9|nr:SMP-30/gluconolactonase/LRE family protein [Nocardioides sp.]HTW14018.1 SMP-30/gluconolactonase/LRE family protein [Nocardioides sp.]